MRVSSDDLINIIAEASNRLHTEIRQANSLNQIDAYLEKLDMLDLMPIEEIESFETMPRGRIIVFGKSEIKEQVIFGIAKSLGLPKERIELHLGYDTINKYEDKIKSLRYNPKYRLIMMGPVPHSTQSTDDFNSVIAKLEGTDGYAKVIHIMDSNGLKITKTSFRKALEKELRSGYLIV